MAHFGVGLLFAVLSIRGLYRFGQWFGTLEWLINYKRRKRFHRVLKRVLGQTPSAGMRRQYTLSFFRQSRCDKLLYLIFDRLTSEQASGLLQFSNREKFDGILSKGKGIYLALSHQGAHHVVAMLLALNGYKTAGVRDRKESGIRRYVQDRVDRHYPEVARMRVIYADSFPREIYRCMKDGYIVGSAMDAGRTRNLQQKTEEVTLMGKKVSFLSGPLRIALRCGTTIVQAFFIPESDFKYRLEIVDQLSEPDEGKVERKEEDRIVSGMMQTYATNLETYLRANPHLISRV